MSLSPFDSFQSRFVTYLFNRPRSNKKMAVTGTRWRSWLRHCATNRKVAGSIPDGVIGFFY